MDYKYQYETSINLNTGSSGSSEDKKEKTIDESLYVFNLKTEVLFTYIEKINSYLKKFDMRLSTRKNSLENIDTSYLIIESNVELSISGGVNSLAIGIEKTNKLLLITFEPMKIIYNSYIKEMGQELIGTIAGKGMNLYIILLNQLEKISDSDLIHDLNLTDKEAEYLSVMYKETKDSLTVLIKIVNVHKEIKNKALIINGLKFCLNIYNKMLADYPVLNTLRFEIDIHSGNWKYYTGPKGRTLIPIDPFVIFYAKLKHTTGIFNKLHKEIMKNIK